MSEASDAWLGMSASKYQSKALPALHTDWVQLDQLSARRWSVAKWLPEAKWPRVKSIASATFGTYLGMQEDAERAPIASPGGAVTTRSGVVATHHPVLSGATGAYHERAPAAELREHFSRTWFNTFPSSGSPVAVVPDGCIDLQWIDGELRIAGPDREAHCESLRPGATVIGFRFRPGVANQWLRVSASAVVGARLPLEVFWGADACRIAAQVGCCADRASIARRLEVALARRAARMPRPDPCAANIQRVLEAAPDLRTDVVRYLCAELQLSERTLRRRCHEAFGYGPKTLQRVLRFQRLLRLARAVEGGSAAFASEAGYADQAHLAREARRMAAMTPARIWQQFQHANQERALVGRSVQDVALRPWEQG